MDQDEVFAERSALCKKFGTEGEHVEQHQQLLPHKERYYNFFQLSLHTRLQGRPDWSIMKQQVPTSYSEAKEMFSDLGQGLRLLLKSSSISDKFLSSIMSNMFDDMNWVVDNQAACLLFSCEGVVKLFLADFTRKEDGILKLSQMLVAMIAVCGRLNNDLNQGLSKILNWNFALFGKRDRRKLIAEFWKEATERLEEGDITEDILVQLGVLVSSRASPVGVEEGGGAVEE